MFLLAFSLLNLVLALDPALVEKEKLSFLERTIVQVLSKGQFPEIVGAETQVLVNCGCTYATMNVNWGSQVGMFCKLGAPGYEEACGKKCVSPKGDDVLLLCPEGWTSGTPPSLPTASGDKIVEWDVLLPDSRPLSNVSNFWRTTSTPSSDTGMTMACS
jgi:hypothetical protein